MSPLDLRNRGFPRYAHPEGLVASTFFAILYNKRALTKREKTEIVNSAIFHGLMQKAPVDECGVQVCRHYRTKKILQSKAGVIVTRKGEKYWQQSVQPAIPEHVSDLGYAGKDSHSQSKKFSREELIRRRKPNVRK